MNMRNSLIILVASIGLSGCIQMLERSDNIRPGETDYPVKKQHPTHVIRLTGVLPKSLDIRFYVKYMAYKGNGKSYCNYTVNWLEGVHAPYTVVEPLEYSRHEDLYEATILVDKYEPGNCAWRIASIDYRVLNGWIEGSQLGSTPFAVSIEDGGSNRKGKDYYEGPVDIWCRKDPTRDIRFPETCEPPAFTFKPTFIHWLNDPRFQELKKLVPKEKQGGKHYSVIFPDTQAIKANFYDVDAILANRRLPE